MIALLDMTTTEVATTSAPGACAMTTDRDDSVRRAGDPRDTIPEYIVCSDTVFMCNILATSCWLCGTRLYIAPSGRRIAEKRNLKPICKTCAGPSPLVEPLTSEQIAEKRAHQQ